MARDPKRGASRPGRSGESDTSGFVSEGISSRNRASPREHTEERVSLPVAGLSVRTCAPSRPPNGGAFEKPVTISQKRIRFRVRRTAVLSPNGSPDCHFRLRRLIDADHAASVSGGGVKETTALRRPEGCRRCRGGIATRPQGRVVIPVREASRTPAVPRGRPRARRRSGKCFRGCTHRGTALPFTRPRAARAFARFTSCWGTRAWRRR